MSLSGFYLEKTSPGMQKLLLSHAIQWTLSNHGENVFGEKNMFKDHINLEQNEAFVSL